MSVQVNGSVMMKLRHLCLKLNTVSVRYTSIKAVASKQTRTTYPRMYRTLLVKPNGSTITIRCAEPRKLLKLPIDITIMSDNDRTNLWLSRQERVVESYDESMKDDFKVDDYKHFWK